MLAQGHDGVLGGAVCAPSGKCRDSGQRCGDQFSRSLVWTLRELDTAFANWFQLLVPAGRVVAIYGLIDPDTAETDETGTDESAADTGEGAASEAGNLLTEYYTPATTAALPAMRLETHDRLVAAADAAGFTDINVATLDTVRGWEASPGSQQPYALIGHRQH